MSFSLFPQKEKVSLLIDIGNGSISGALVLYSDKGHSTLLYCTRSSFQIDERPESHILLQTMEKLLNTVLTSVIQNGFAQNYFKKNSKSISSVLVSFSSPWFVSKIKHSHVDENKPFLVTEDYIKNILAREEKGFENELLESQYESFFGANLKVVENVVVKTKINGYCIKNSLNKKTTSLDLSLYMSVASKSIIDAVYKQIFSHTHISEKHINIHSFPLITFSVVRNLFPTHDNYIILDVTAEVTDITLVLEDTTVQTTSFPSGRNFIIRKISKSFGVTTEIAESNLHMYITKKSDLETSSKMQEVFLDIEKEWSIYFEDALSELSKNSSLPSILYMTAESDVAKVYSTFIKLEKTNQTSVFRKNVEIIPINEQMLSNTYKKDVRFPPNEFIAILATFFGKIR